MLQEHVMLQLEYKIKYRLCAKGQRLQQGEIFRQQEQLSCWLVVGDLTLVLVGVLALKKNLNVGFGVYWGFGFGAN